MSAQTIRLSEKTEFVADGSKSSMIVLWHIICMM